MKRASSSTQVSLGFTAFALALASVVLGAPDTAQADAGVPKYTGPLPTGTGAPFGPFQPRPALDIVACDSIMPICVHANSASSAEEIRRVRTAAARAWDALVETLRVPRPLSDGEAGGDARFDVYLDPARPLGDDPLALGRDPLALFEDRDAAPAFVVLSAAVLEDQTCALSFELARGVARASAAGLDVAETPTVVDGFARHLASRVAPCRSRVTPQFQKLQDEPFRSLTATSAGPQLLAAYLDEKRGEGYGALVPATWSLGTEHFGIVVPTVEDFEYGPMHFRNQPTVLDVLGATLHDQGSSFEELLLEVAVSRALDHPEAPPHLEWPKVVVSTLPRRLAVPTQIEALGATFMKVELDRRPRGESVELDLKWEQGARFRWAVIKVDAQGKTLGQVGVPALDRQRELTIEVRRLEGASAIWIVGINTGDPARGFRPDDPPILGHGYELAIFEPD